MKKVLKSIIRKGSQVLTLQALLFSQFVKAQDSTFVKLPNKKALQFCINDALYGNFNLTYISFYKKHRAYEVMVGYRTNLVFGQESIGDKYDVDYPVLIYPQYTARTGLRFYQNEGLYVSTMLTTTYGYFDNVHFKIYSKDISEGYVSSERKSIGGIIKLGFSPIHKRFIMDLYIGAGYKFSYINDEIKESIVRPVVAQKRNYWITIPTIHIGLQLGLILN